MSRPGGYQGYGAVREYRDDPNYQQYEDNLGTSYDEEFSQITKSISNINTGASVIEQAAKVIGTDRDNGQAADKIHHVSQETNKVVKDTMRLMRTLGSKRLDRKQKLQLDKTKNDFQDSVQRFQSLQKWAAEKVKTAQRMEKPKPKPQSAGWLDDDNDEAGLVVDDQRRQHLMAQEQVIDDDLGLIQEREDRIRELESDILDVNEIFRDLGAMVYDQGERIDTIEANVETAYTDVEAGTEQLQKASTYQADNVDDNEKRNLGAIVYDQGDTIEANLEKEEESGTEQLQTVPLIQEKTRKKICCLLIVLLTIAAIIALLIAWFEKKWIGPLFDHLPDG